MARSRTLRKDRWNVEGDAVMDQILKKADYAFETLSRLLLTMRMSAFVFSYYAILQGCLIIFCSESRFGAVAYSTAASVPGAPDIWGITLLIFGILSFYSLKTRNYRIGAISMFFCGIWSLLFASAFLVSAMQNSEANLTAIAAYFRDTVLFLFLSSAHRDLAKQQKQDRELDE